MTEAVVRFLALGNGVWLDEIRNEDSEPIQDVPGGSVTFATLGARIFSAHEPRSIAMAFNAGHDFPGAVIEAFQSWSVKLDVHHIPTKPSARGLVFYSKANSNRKGFQRLTEPLPVTVEDVRGTPLLGSDTFHFFGNADYVEKQAEDIATCRAEGTTAKPFIIWEPEAKSSLPGTLQAHRNVASLVDVFSPNHEELDSFFNHQHRDSFDQHEIERQAEIFIQAGIGKMGAGCMLVRAAGHGCLVMSRHSRPVWLPSFYASNSDKIVDPTGAGNAFLGAFAIGWQETRDYIEAARYGAVGASIALEQVGLPSLAGTGETELWNGENVRSRLASYRRRCGA